jgi:hypothetical protein
MSTTDARTYARQIADGLAVLAPDELRRAQALPVVQLAQAIAEGRIFASDVNDAGIAALADAAAAAAAPARPCV